MIGLDYVREELKKRGFRNHQIQSEVVPAVIDILANTDNKYLDIWKQEKDVSQRLKEMNRLIAGNELTMKWQKSKINELENDVLKARKHRAHCEDYIEEFNKSLYECETQEGRDAMRTAQMYVNSVDINSKYDNTAFIIGLASILSKGGLNAVSELHKINKKLPKTWYETLELEE